MEDDYVVEEYSDIEDDSSSSSEDELEGLIRNKYGIVEVQDDFEDEMDKVIIDNIRKNDPTNLLFQIGDMNETSAPIVAGPSDASGLESTTLSNDDMLYDPLMDEEDQKWMDDKRRAYIYPSEDSSTEKPKRLPNSDAVLNCPACLSLLCLDCQRHELYKNQYRAMFVSNCTVVLGETLSFPIKQKKLRRKALGQCSAEMRDDSYNPVQCTVCKTGVAVYDRDEVYHFYNVLASHT